MKRRMWCQLPLLLLAVMSTGTAAFAQPAVLPSERLDVPGVTQRAGAGAWADVWDWDYNWASSYPPDVTDGDVTMAVAAQGASANVGSVSAMASTLASAMCLNAVGSVDFVPQVDTTMNVSATAMGQDFGWGEAVAYGDCYGQGRFRVVANPALPNVTTGVLTSSLYLVATGGDTDCGYLGMTSLGAGAGGSSADAYGDGGGFMVYAYLSNANGSDEEIFDFVPGAGLNNLYVGTENTGIGATHSVWAYIDCYYDGAYACTDGGSLWGFSASAWYAIY